MKVSALLRLAVLGESLLVVVALAWLWWRQMSLVVGGLVEGLLVGCSGAAALAVASFYLLCRAPDVQAVRSVRRLYIETLKPVFGSVSLAEIVVISVAAGIGEELLFRGVLQPEVGLVTASIIFGLLHMGGIGTLFFGCWVMLMGSVLGYLAIWTEGLLASIVAHAVYDAIAMSYMRWGQDCGMVSGHVLERPNVQIGEC